MVALTALWLPILLSAVAVFIASSIIHMVLPYHRSDYTKLPDEEKVRAALRAASVVPGSYVFPHAASPKDMGSAEMTEKYIKGPVGLMTVMPNGPPAMGRALVQWFIYCLVIGVFVAYLASSTLGLGAEGLEVFRVVGTAGFLGYAAAHVSNAIWKGESWSMTGKSLFDGLVYGLLTAGVFAWLWP